MEPKCTAGPTMLASKILVIEDDPDIAGLLKLHLTDSGYSVDVAADGTSGLASAAEPNDWSLIVLDLQLPGVDGLEICRAVRSGLGYTPILMLTARAGELDRVRGFDSGADDYLTKPFSLVEFAARVKAILRRAERLARPPLAELRTCRIGDLAIDLDRRTAYSGGRRVDLTAREFDLLAFLMERPERVFSRAQLLDHVWGTTHDTFEHTVNSHINRLRSKVEPDPSNPRYIVTVWGVGYRLARPPEALRA
jgi:two-component system, OmpR family, response regulator